MEERPASDPSETARADVAISDKARPRSRARTTLVGCGVIFVALLVVWATSDSYQSAKPETLGIEPKQIESPKSSPALAESRDPPPARRVAAGNAAPSRTQSAEKLDDAIEVCGHGTIPQHAVDRLIADDRKARSILAIVANSLSQSANPSDRVVGLMTKIEQSLYANCAAGGECPNFAILDRASWRQLLEMANATTDPSIYAPIVTACRRAQMPDCGAINANRLSQMDPQNAFAWLAVAHEATQQGDVARRDMALERAAAATLYRPYIPDFGNLLESVVLAGDTGIVDVQITSFIITMQAVSQSGTSSASALPFCRAKEIDATGRRSLCLKLADLQEKSAESLIDLALANAVGKAAGWPAEKSNALQKEYDDLVKVMMELGQVEAKSTLSCQTLEQLLPFVRNTLAGELAALRRFANSRAKGIP
jgi:hypothetical protein